MSLFNRLTVKHAEKTATNAKIVQFHVPEQLAAEYQYRAGQHLVVKQQIDGKEYRRSYSICQHSDDTISIGVRAVENGVVSTWIVNHLEPDMEVKVMPPSGSFTVKDTEEIKSRVFFAAGCGITPIISQVKQTLIEQPDVNVRLFYLNKSLASTMFIEELGELKNVFTSQFELVCFFTQENQQVEWLNERMDQAKVDFLVAKKLIPTLSTDFYICGPVPLIKTLTEALVNNGVEKSHIHFENFNTGAVSTQQKRRKAKQSHSGELQQVKIKIMGKVSSIPFHGVGNILQAGLDVNLDLPYACQAGVCGTCRCKLVSGEVDVEDNFSLEDYDLEQGYILACQAKPKNSNEVLVDFDI